MNLKDSFTAHIKSTNTKGSNKASSYIRAIELLNPILAEKAPSQFQPGNLWKCSSAKTIHALYTFILEQQKLGEEGLFSGQEPVSYWRDGYCSAALNCYKEFLIIRRYGNRFEEIYNKPELSGGDIGRQMVVEDVESADLLFDDEYLDLSGKTGQDVLRSVKSRIGQDVFWRVILKQYNTRCCVTGLNIPEVLRASHISGWADDETNRMNPSNGLCLSATYDAAFDKHLVSFDENYRLILAPSLRDYTTNEAFHEYFQKKEGNLLALPGKHPPDQALLEKHRERMPA